MISIIKTIIEIIFKLPKNSIIRNFARGEV